MAYAVVRAGGRQEKVEVGTILTIDRAKADDKGNIDLAPVLLVDGDKITSAASELANVTVTAEVLEDLRGPKVVIQKFKNKTGYKKRQGFRAEHTRVQSTSTAKAGSRRWHTRRVRAPLATVVTRTHSASA